MDYSQKRLLSRPLGLHGRGTRTRRLQIYAVLTGFFSMLVSLAGLIIRIVR